MCLGLGCGRLGCRLGATVESWRPEEASERRVGVAGRHRQLGLDRRARCRSLLRSRLSLRLGPHRLGISMGPRARIRTRTRRARRVWRLGISRWRGGLRRVLTQRIVCSDLLLLRFGHLPVRFGHLLLNLGRNPGSRHLRSRILGYRLCLRRLSRGREDDRCRCARRLPRLFMWSRSSLRLLVSLHRHRNQRRTHHSLMDGRTR